MPEPNESKYQFSLRTMFLLVFAFSLGFVARNVADGLHPFSTRLIIPSSTSSIRVGESLSIESPIDPSINRSVTVMADGTIDLPLVGIVNVSGQTTTQLEMALNKSFANWIATPSIQVYRSEMSQAAK